MAPDEKRKGTTKRLGGAMMLGVATIFVPKTKPEDHWSKSPVPTLEVQTPARNPLDGYPEVDDLLATLPPVRTHRAASRWRFFRRTRRRR